MNLWGYINDKGESITPIQFNQAQPFSEGLAGVFQGKKFGYINGQGEYVIEPQYDNGSEFSEGLATVRLGKMERVIDKQGNTIFELAASRIGQCKERFNVLRN